MFARSRSFSLFTASQITNLKLPTSLRRRLALPTGAVALLTSAALTFTAAPRATAQLGGAVTTTTTTVSTTTATPQARLIEWDLPAQSDVNPGAMVVDTMGHDKNRVWFVTRVGVPHVYRLEMPHSFMKGSARWTGWELNGLLTGGIKKIRASKDRRFVFVRTVSQDLAAALQRIDTQSCYGGTCDRTVWNDPTDPTEFGMDVSDVAIDDRNNVYITHSPESVATDSYVQKLTPGVPYATVTRWIVGGGAGLCPSISNDPCVSGIDVHPSNDSLVYYSESANNAIAELNTATSRVRRWSLDALTAACTAASTMACAPISEPRQLHVDRWGKVWVVTGSGHLVSLDPCSNKMTSHQMPDRNAADPFGIAPDDDVVGYTASLSNKVGMLLPRGRAFRVTPQEAGVPKVTKQMPAERERATVTSGRVSPEGKTVAAQVSSQPDGTFIEAKIDTPNDSRSPMGISPAKAKSQGTFFYAVGFNDEGADRVGFVRLPIKDKIKHPRDDDDEDDGWDGDDKWHAWHQHGNSHDRDDDGIDDDDDSPSGREEVTVGDSSPLQGGQKVDYSMTASSTTLALIAKATADDPLAQIGIDIYDAAGLLVARSVPTPGVAAVQVLLPAAGSYTARVRNDGLSAINHTPTLIVREPLDLSDPLLDPLP